MTTGPSTVPPGRSFMSAMVKGNRSPVTVFEIAIVAFGGMAAGFINTLAGGGSAITIPILTEILGANIANGTNRVAIQLANLAALGRFQKGGVVPWKAVLPVLPAAMIGAGLGAYTTTQVSAGTIQRAFAVVLVLVCVVGPRQPVPLGRGPQQHPPHGLASAHLPRHRVLRRVRPSRCRIHPARCPRVRLWTRPRQRQRRQGVGHRRLHTDSDLLLRQCQPDRHHRRGGAVAGSGHGCMDRRKARHHEGSRMGAMGVGRSAASSPQDGCCSRREANQGQGGSWTIPDTAVRLT